MDERTFPIAAAYVARLPAGLASHPDCQVKGSVLRGLLDSTPIAFETPGLPGELADLVRTPPLPSDWIPEVHFNALMLAHEDRIPHDIFREWVYSRNRKLLSSNLYRMLFFLITPQRLFMGMANRWKAFRRGTELVMRDHGKNHANVEVRYPLRLYELHALTNLTVAVTAALDAAGGQDTSVRLLSHDDRTAQIAATWR
ncbi:MAG: hypothetical protein IPM79_37255 [Polyangiaceae bacterium]|nr:hypothetical protein [Polyangiaceae bacterium]MBK8943101.1 hypothetical protein [Polyangiaceae bacterium]